MARRLIKTQEDLGRLVRVYRESYGYKTQEKLAEALETNRSAIAHLEQGARLPDGELLAQVCRHLAIPEKLWLGFKVAKLPGAEVEVRGTSFVYYTPWGRADPLEKRRDRLVFAVKNNEEWTLGGRQTNPYEHTARMLKKSFPDLFANRTFVPVPKSRINRGLPDTKWASLQLALAFAAAGEDCEVNQLVHRVKACRQSSDPKADQSKRPSVAEQIETLEFVGGKFLPPGIVLVDDVVTKGTTMVACAQLLRNAGWPGLVEALTAGYAKAPGEQDPGEYKRFLYRWSPGETWPRRDSET